MFKMVRNKKWFKWNGKPCSFFLDMAAVFDLAKTRIGNKRDQVEEALRERIDKFENKVNILK